jgi:hypothetical protein
LGVFSFFALVLSIAGWEFGVYAWVLIAGLSLWVFIVLLRNALDNALSKVTPPFSNETGTNSTTSENNDNDTQNSS